MEFRLDVLAIPSADDFIFFFVFYSSLVYDYDCVAGVVNDMNCCNCSCGIYVNWK